MTKFYHYEVTQPITDYGFNKKVGDMMTTEEILSLPPFYKKYVTLLSSPVMIINFSALSPVQVERAKEFYHLHEIHVSKLMNSTTNYYEPSITEDKNNPVLWKGNHWGWFREYLRQLKK